MLCANQWYDLLSVYVFYDVNFGYMRIWRELEFNLFIRYDMAWQSCWCVMLKLLGISIGNEKSIFDCVYAPCLCILWVQLACHRTTLLHYLWSLVLWITEARIVCYLSSDLSDLCHLWNTPSWMIWLSVYAESSRGQNPLSIWFWFWSGSRTLVYH